MSRDQRGFTLVELLVAITVLALVGALVTGLVRVVQQSWAKVGSIAEEGERGRAARELLRREIARALPLGHRVGNDTVPEFVGTADRLSFVVEAPSWAAPAVLRAWLIEVNPTDTGDRRLLVRRADLRAGDDSTEALAAAEPLLLLENARIDLAYLADQRAGPPDWTDRFREPGRLPHAVRIASTDAEGRQDALVVPIRIDGEARCGDAGGQRCGVD